jgi:dTDP-4-amino-4,6-dideoxygalactose transaminase
MEVLASVQHYDFYHLPQYHRVEERRLNANAHLFTYSEGDYLIALPLLLRAVEETEWTDATSVYGYAGPVASDHEMPGPVVRNFHAALEAWMIEHKVVAAFSRLHPLIQNQENLLDGLGQYCPNGQTVAIDLTLPLEEQVAQYQRGVRKRVNKYRREGLVVCLHDEEQRYMGEFISIYNETMRRLHAGQSYFFGEEYFNCLTNELGSVLHLFVAFVGDEIAAAELCTLCDGIVEAHLCGTRDKFVQLSPMTLIHDAVRLWGTDLGARALHLGGGLGGKQDSLFSYKATFSEQRYNFATWRWTIQPEIYAELCERRLQTNRARGLEPTCSSYFPAFRCPMLPCKNGTAETHAQPRIYLSPPHMGEAEMELVKEAFASNWVAPVGPHLDAFEHELAEYVGVSNAVALSSGTAAIHLAVRLLGVQSGDEVFCSTLTFAASANPIVYEGATPVFIDSESRSWNIDPELLRAELDACAARGRLPRAVIVVDLYGQSADYDQILAACAPYGVPVIQDSAEALGAFYKGRKAGTQGHCGIFSFNGNKIITASGGGMLVSSEAALIERARFLATQAREPAPHYQHSTIGFNYRLSNVLAGIGRGQLKVLNERIAARRHNFEQYKARLGDVVGIEFMPLASYGEANYWLTCITIDPAEFGASREAVCTALAQQNIEARPVWKPLHMQPVFARCRVRGGGVAESIFARGLCLPSGSNLTQTDIDRICAIILSAPKRS